MLEQATAAVGEFMANKNIDYRTDLTKLPVRNDMPQLLCIMKQHAESSLLSYKQLGDLRLLRIHLVLEESVEFISAVLNSNEEETLDAMADLIYVILGAAITFDLPLAEGFAEVHRSNMSKRAKPLEDKSSDNCRLQDKGAEYSPPNLAKIIKDKRACSSSKGRTARAKQPSQRKSKS